MSPRVCLFTDSLEPSGVGEHMLTLTRALRDHYRLTFICPDTPPTQPLLERAAALGVVAIGRTVRQSPEAQRWLCDWLAAERIDLFHGHAGAGWEGLRGIRAAHEAGVPAIVRTEHLPDIITRPGERADHMRMQRLVQRIICVSEAVSASFQRTGVPAHKLRVVRNGVAVAPVCPDRLGVRARLGLPAGSRLVLTVGRLSEQKGHTYLLAAAPAVLARRPDVHVVLVGRDELEGALHDQAAALGIADHVHFLGRRDDVAALLAAADLFVLPSLFEGLPLSVLEAMAAGLPVVGTRIGGTEEAVADGVTGRLVPARDPAALAAAMLEVLDDPEKAARWGAAGRRRQQAEFSATRMVRDTRAIYDELLAAAGRPTSRPALPLPLGTVTEHAVHNGRL